MLAPPVFNGKIHYNWPFSIAMLNYQRVYCMYNVHINKSTIDYSIYSKASYKLTSSCEKSGPICSKGIVILFMRLNIVPSFRQSTVASPGSLSPFHLNVTPNVTPGRRGLGVSYLCRGFKGYMGTRCRIKSYP